MKVATWTVLMLALGATACGGFPGTREAEATSAVRQSLLDPPSGRITVLGHSKYVTCGTVNAKNRMGGYVGETPWIYEYSIKTVKLFQGSPSASDYRSWSDETDPAQKEESYQKMEVGCSLPAMWKTECPDAHANIMDNPAFCVAWRKQDLNALYRMSHSY